MRLFRSVAALTKRVPAYLGDTLLLALAEALDELLEVGADGGVDKDRLVTGQHRGSVLAICFQAR